MFTFYGGLGLLVLRVALGAILIAHGWPKVKGFKESAAWMASVGFKPGTVFAAIAVLVEFVGGIFLIAGFLVQSVAFFAVIEFFMIVTWKLKNGKPLNGGYELDLLLFAAAVALFFLGGGSYSIDRIFLHWV